MNIKFYGASLLAVATMTALPAIAAPVFTVTPSVLGGPASSFTANKLSGNASSLLTLNSANNTVSGQGFVDFTSFSTDSQTVGPLTSGLQVYYDIWTEFTYTTKLISGTFGAAGSLYDVTSLLFTVYAKQGVNNTYHIGSVNPAVAPSVTVGPTGTLQILGTGVLDAAGPDGASFNQGGGTSFNANSVFTLSAFGKTFFTQPNPFYTNAFNSFTNTSNGFIRSGNQIALTQADGAIDFANRVPEPSSIALLGLGLLIGSSLIRRRRAG